MSDSYPQIAAEIASLQRRADQLAAGNVSSERLLAELTAEADAARAADAAGVPRLDRRIDLIRRRSADAVREIRTLEQLIAARRARYGLAASGDVGTGLS